MEDGAHSQLLIRIPGWLGPLRQFGGPKCDEYMSAACRLCRMVHCKAIQSVMSELSVIFLLLWNGVENRKKTRPLWINQAQQCCLWPSGKLNFCEREYLNAHVQAKTNHITHNFLSWRIALKCGLWFTWACCTIKKEILEIPWKDFIIYSDLEGRIRPHVHHRQEG